MAMESNGPCNPASTRDVIRAYLDILAVGEPFLFGLWQEYGMSLTQMRILRLLAQSQHTAGSLAQAAGLPKSSLSRVLIRLEDKNLVRRETDRTDRRRIHILLTEDGTNMLERWPTPVLQELARAVDGMSDEERGAFVGSAQRLTHRMREAQEETWQAQPPPAKTAPSVQAATQTGQSSITPE